MSYTRSRTMKIWDQIPEQDKATVEGVREFFRHFGHNSTKRANKTISVLLNPICHAALPLNFLDSQRRAPYVPCKSPVLQGQFCVKHGGARRRKIPVRNRIAGAWRGWKNARPDRKPAA